jgi:hypothetical protein
MAIAVFLIAIAVAGCGSGGDGSTTAPTPATGESSSEQIAAGKIQKNGSKRLSQDKKKGPSARSQHSDGAGSGGGKTGSKSEGGQDKNRQAAKVKRKLAEACPKGMSEDSCRANIEGSLKAKQAKSTRVSDPKDCTKVMARSECEEVLEQQHVAEQESSGVNVDECLAHPTPHCEEVLREDLERQQSAQQAGG